MPTRLSFPIAFISACGVFLFALTTSAGMTMSMFGDSDPFWHLAAGDWIRLHARLPVTDPFSFTAGDYRWYNISWAWDCLYSWACEAMGWHGIEMLNAVTVALIVTLVYAASLASCGAGIPAFLTAMAVFNLMPLALRPLQITNLMVALWILILGMTARGQCRRQWLAVLPISMVAWVNMHGGFIAGPVLLGGFWLDALRRKDKALAGSLLANGVACLAALFINPYGLDILEAVARPMLTGANHFLNEWQPFSTSFYNMIVNFYLVLFVLLVIGRPLPVSRAERWLSYLWLAWALTSWRSIGIFGIVSAPVFAVRLNELMKARRPPPPRAIEIGRQATRLCESRAVQAAALAACVAYAGWVLSPASTRILIEEEVEIPNMHAEVEYLRDHLPAARMLTHFDLGALIAHESGGTVPVFIDSRTETAFPAEVMEDYLAFEYGQPDWQDMLAEYRIDGVLIPKGTPPFIGPRDALVDRFREREGWTLAFEGPVAFVFVKEK